MDGRGLVAINGDPLAIHKRAISQAKAGKIIAWYGEVVLNHRPLDPQTSALTN
jgi:hypothetical protein